METPKYPKGHPQLANVAINQAKNLAKNLKRLDE
jgi:NADH dehydrogenase